MPDGDPGELLFSVEVIRPESLPQSMHVLPWVLLEASTG
jgi:hypothetical protein